MECYRPQQTTTTTDASEQNNTDPLGGPVITVTEVFVLHLPLVDRGRITWQINLFFSARKQTQIEMFSVGVEMSLSIAAASGLLTTCSIHARGVRETEKVMSPVHRCVRGTTSSPHDEARSADRAGMSPTGDVSKWEMYSGVARIWCQEGHMQRLLGFYRWRLSTNSRCQTLYTSKCTEKKLNRYNSRGEGTCPSAP